jgi:hypothetical protein
LPAGGSAKSEARKPPLRQCAVARGRLMLGFSNLAQWVLYIALLSLIGQGVL